VDESLFGFEVAGEIGGKEFQGNETFEFEVLGFINDTHATAPKVLEDFVVRNRLTDEIRHDNSS
jgi:hypothetical protein